MKILVTGGAGFIGSNVVDAYTAAGHEVGILDNLSTGKKQNLNPKAKFFQVDLCNREQVFATVADFSPNVINHHAAQIDVRKSVTDPVFNAEVNEIGTLNLLDAAVRNKVTKNYLFLDRWGPLW